MKRWFYRLEHYLRALHLVATHFREQRLRAGRCYHPGCMEHGIVWLDRSGIYCWDHYVEQMRGVRRT